MTDVITFIFEPHDNVNITNVTPYTTTSIIESSRYTYWDTNEYPIDGVGLLPNGGLMITI